MSREKLTPASIILSFIALDVVQYCRILTDLLERHFISNTQQG